MSKLPSFTPKQVIQKLQKLGFVKDHQTGSHIVMFNPNNKKRVVVPYHLKDLPKGTLATILRESGISRQLFLSNK